MLNAAVDDVMKDWTDSGHWVEMDARPSSDERHLVSVQISKFTAREIFVVAGGRFTMVLAVPNEAVWAVEGGEVCVVSIRAASFVITFSGPRQGSVTR
jgi:hypothetical protein